jgi:hypothetical protein
MRILYSLTEGPHARGGRSCESCHSPGGRAPDQTFLLMQGELGVSARISDDVTFVYSNDLGLTRDAYGVIRVGGGGAYVKAGIFEVPFGLEDIKDHNTLVKARYDVGSNLRDVGVEVALQTPRHFASVAVLNGGQRLPDTMPVLTSSIDPNGSPSLVARAGLIAARVRVGGSFMFDDSLAGSRPRQIVGGGFGTVYGDRWRASAEFDVGSAKLGGYDAMSMGAVALATVTPLQDLDVSVKFDFFDPDTDVDGDRETWYSAIIERRVTRNVSLQARARVRDEEKRESVIPEDTSTGEIANNDFLTMLHVHF